MSKEVVYVGIDVSKHQLDICSENQRFSLPNTPQGFRALHQRLKREKAKELRVVCEATGGYEKNLVQTLRKTSMILSVVNPRQVRDFARAKGVLAKTDRLDAEVLAHYGELMRPRPLDATHEICETLKMWVNRRTQLLQMIQQEHNHTEHSSIPEIQKMKRLHLRQLQRQLFIVETRIQQTIQQTPLLQKRAEALRQTRGVGPATIATLLAHMPELGSLSRQQAAALIGVAPYNRDSGLHRGHRSIRGGRHHLRKALYMSALAATQHNPILRDFYQRLRKNGKPAKVALVAVMRKLIIRLNTSLKNIHFNLDHPDGC